MSNVFSLDTARARRIASEVARYGNLENAIAGCLNDQADEMARELMAEKSRLARASETLDERAFRLGLMAADKDAEGERHMAAEADAAGRAAGRRLRDGEDSRLAASFDREAAACLMLANECMAEAERLRSQAAAIHRSADHDQASMSGGFPPEAA